MVRSRLRTQRRLDQRRTGITPSTSPPPSLPRGFRPPLPHNSHASLARPEPRVHCVPRPEPRNKLNAEYRHLIACSLETRPSVPHTTEFMNRDDAPGKAPHRVSAPTNSLTPLAQLLARVCQNMSFAIREARLSFAADLIEDCVNLLRQNRFRLCRRVEEVQFAPRFALDCHPTGKIVPPPSQPHVPAEVVKPEQDAAEVRGIGDL